MSDHVDIKSFKSTTFEDSTPVLSILVPFYKDDPTDLILSLEAQIASYKNVELCLYNDGTNDPAIQNKATEAIKVSKGAITLLTALKNNGRSFARNTLRQHAQANWVLFLDADMRPVTDHFIADYLAYIQRDDADIIFGGFKVPHKSIDPETELHRAFSETSDCLTLEDRKKFGPQYVCSSNLCVRKTVLETDPFDPEFTGWGWEDSEWAARVTNKYRLVHADIPALHLGLETTDTLLRRFKDSGHNYQRFTDKHPDLARTLTLYNVTQKLKRFPGQKMMRPFLKGLAKSKMAPIRLRLTALKLWRASWYAEAL